MVTVMSVFRTAMIIMMVMVMVLVMSIMLVMLMVMSMVIVVAIRWNDNDGWEDADDGWSPAPSNYNNQDRKVERRQVWLMTRFLGVVRSGVAIWQVDI